MKKYLVLLLCLFLVGCGDSLYGKWTNPEGTTLIDFEEEKVFFFGVEGTYDVKGKTLTLYVGSKTLVYDFELEKNQLTLYLEDGQLKLERATE